MPVETEGARVDVEILGTTLPGHERGDVMPQLARLINRDADVAEQLLSGRTVRVKSAVEASLGARYIAALEHIGVAARTTPLTLEIDRFDPDPQRASRADGLNPSGPSELAKMKSIGSVPNALFLLLVVTTLATKLHAAGASPLAFRGSAHVYGEATVYFLLPLVFGAAWNLLPGDRPGLLWSYISSTALFLLIVIVGAIAS